MPDIASFNSIGGSLPTPAKRRIAFGFLFKKLVTAGREYWSPLTGVNLETIPMTYASDVNEYSS
jgi:hypothetical protein